MVELGDLNGRVGNEVIDGIVIEGIECERKGIPGELGGKYEMWRGGEVEIAERSKKSSET